MKNVISTAMVLTGTFIGAGFASGQEIMQYFGVFGKFGIVGVLISCILLGAFTYCTADNISCLGEKSYVEQICKFRCVNWLFNCYMLLIFCTMITAFGESLNQAFDFPKIYGVILIDAVTIIILYFGAGGLIKLNSAVTPLIILGIVFVFCIKNTTEVFSYNNFVSSGIIYTSYNVISLPFVMIGIKNILSSKKNIMLCTTVFCGIIFVLALCILCILKGVDTTSAIPLLNAVSEDYTLMFIFLLAMAMLTTAVSNGYGFINAVGINKNVSLVFLFVFSLLFSLFSFGFIVRYLYSFFGYMGLYILLTNFNIFLKNREKPRKIKKIYNNYK